MYLEERGWACLTLVWNINKTGGMCDQIIAKHSPHSSLDRSENIVFLPFADSLDLPIYTNSILYR
jgi:hypothetical protein